MNKLFKTNSKAQVASWEVVVEGNSYYEITGIKTLTRHKPKFATVKNKGKKNEVSPEEQAIKEAKALWTKKVSEGYSEVVGKYNPIEEPVMLAENWHDELTFKFIQKQLYLGTKAYVQRKMDGICSKHLGDSIRSRTDKLITSCPHLVHNLGFSLHGELYNHCFGGNLGKIASLTSPKVLTPEILAESEAKIQMHVYDILDSKEVYSKRHEKLQEIFYLGKLSNYFKLVPSYSVSSIEEIDSYYEQFLAEGYEGLILRFDTSGYEFRRTKQLIKRKPFTDSEFEIVNVIEGIGNRAGTVGKIICKTPEGLTFASNPVGEAEFKTNREYITHLWNIRDTLIGKLATIKYVKLNENGIPRDHTCIAIRDYE